MAINHFRGTLVPARETQRCKSSSRTSYQRTGAVIPRGFASPASVTGLAGAPVEFIGLCIRDPRLGAALTITSTGCWEWSGRTDSNGYGMTTRDGRGQRTHRYV